MSDGFIVDLPYKFELFDGIITPFSLREPSSHLGIGIIDVPAINNNTSTVADPYLGIGIVDKAINTIIPARISANKLGIGIVDEPIVDINFGAITPPYLGIGIIDEPTVFNNLASLAPAYLGISIVDASSKNNNLAALAPAHLGIGVTDIASVVNNIASLASRRLGIGIADKKLIYDNQCGTSTSRNRSKKIRFVCEQNKIDIQIPKTPPSNWLFKNLKAFKIVEKPHNVKNMDNWLADDLRKDKNNPNKPDKEAPRLLTHLIFDPLDKPAVSTWYLTYTLEIEVERTDKLDITHIASPSTTNIFEYNSTILTSVWTIHHQLAFIPTVEVFINNVIYTPLSVTHVDNNTTIIKFNSPKMGMARLY